MVSAGLSWQSFARGLKSVCGSDVLSLCRSDELEMLICGSPELVSRKSCTSKALMTPVNDYVRLNIVIDRISVVLRSLHVMKMDTNGAYSFVLIYSFI